MTIELVLAGLAIIISVVTLVLQTKSSNKALKESANANMLSARALSQNAEANDLAALGAVLQLEASMISARANMSDAIREVQAQPANTAASLRLDDMIESYLNLVDRLCACIRWGYVGEDRYRGDYRELVADAYEQNLTVVTLRYRHIQHVHVAWKNEKSALDGPEQTSRALNPEQPRRALGA